MELHEAIRSRRSIRRYRPETVPDVVITRLLESACWAPSAHNRQPWRFAVVTTADARQRLALAMGARLRADLERDGAPQEVVEKDIERSYTRITGAPVVILACLTLADMDHYPDDQRAQAEWTMAAQSVAMAVQNLLLSAHAEGLGACWMCAPLFAPDVARTALDLPDDWQPQALITLGYPAQPPRDKPRAPLSSRVVRR
jgi:F420 biosynthesis protein FbiB-like protein